MRRDRTLFFNKKYKVNTTVVCLEKNFENIYNLIIIFHELNDK